MAIPASKEGRIFYRCAFQRYHEARTLLRTGYTTGAVYLAGYGVECILKALVLASVAPGTETATLKRFRGNRGHDYEWLREVYLSNGGAKFPREIARHFNLVNDWSTDLRYLPRALRTGDAEVFLNSADAILRWADGRL